MSCNVHMYHVYKGDSCILIQGDVPKMLAYCLKVL